MGREVLGIKLGKEVQVLVILNWYQFGEGHDNFKGVSEESGQEETLVFLLTDLDVKSHPI